MIRPVVRATLRTVSALFFFAMTPNPFWAPAPGG